MRISPSNTPLFFFYRSPLPGICYICNDYLPVPSDFSLAHWRVQNLGAIIPFLLPFLSSLQFLIVLHTWHDSEMAQQSTEKGVCLIEPRWQRHNRHHRGLLNSPSHCEALTTNGTTTSSPRQPALEIGKAKPNWAVRRHHMPLLSIMEVDPFETEKGGLEHAEPATLLTRLPSCCLFSCCQLSVVVYLFLLPWVKKSVLSFPL
jgi:hypothetical protein